MSNATKESTLPIAGEGKALDEEQIAKLIWQHLPSKVAEEMTRDKHPPLFPQAEYTVATLSAKNFVEAIIDLVTPSSPGKDGGQEVVAATVLGYVREAGLRSLAERNHTSIYPSPDEERGYTIPVYAQPASTALVERLTSALQPFAQAADDIERTYGNDLPEWQIQFPQLPMSDFRRARSALSASTSTEGER